MVEIRRTTAQALDVLDAVLSSIDHGERGRLSASEKVALMGRARRLQDRVTSLACVLTDEVNRSQSSMAATGTPITSLLALEEGRDTSEAAREVFQARDVALHEAVKQAALAGTLSSRHAAAISKGMALLPAGLTAEQRVRAEQVFMDKAPGTTPRKLATLAQEVVAEVAPELVETPGRHADLVERQHRRAVVKRAFAWGDDGDGSMWFRGSLPHLQATPLIRVVEAYVESDRRTSRDRLKATRATRPHPQIVRDQATAEIQRTPDQRRAHALTHLVRDHRSAPSSIGDRPRIVVTIREQDLRDRAEKAGVLAKGEEITAGDLRRLCCDADLMPVVLGGPSEILDVGHTQRLVTPPIRKALSLRDGGCVFPHCTTPDAACEARHIQPHINSRWDTGATALWNLVLLCPHHHTLVEPDRYNRSADKWIIHIDPDTGQAVVTPPQRTERFANRSSTQRNRACTSPPEPESGASQGSAEPGAHPLRSSASTTGHGEAPARGAGLALMRATRDRGRGSPGKYP